jgi:hypothetical protein
MTGGIECFRLGERRHMSGSRITRRAPYRLNLLEARIT